MPQNEYSLCIVCGAPRSGTTLLQAILSSADDANNVVPECSYLTSLAEAYDLGLKKYQETYYYFDSLDAYHAYNAKLIGSFIDSIWVRLGRPRILVLKNPAISKVVPTLAEIVPQARFFVAVRNPNEVVASRIKVIHRANPATPITHDQIRYVCRQYVDYYRPLVENAAKLDRRLLWLAYDEFAAGKKFAEIERFIDTRVRPDKLWADAELGFLPEWLTDLYFTPPSTASVDKHEQVLSADHARIVEFETSEIYRSLNRILGRTAGRAGN